jgi:hypothetical protein
VETELQGLAAMLKTVEELQATREVEAQKVWGFPGQTKMALAPLGFSPIRSREPTHEVRNVLLVLESIGAKMLTLEEVIREQLEAEGCVMEEKVVEHMLTCFRSLDPKVSLDPMVHGPTIETKEAARGSIQEAVKIVVARFQWQPEDK